MAPNTTAAIEEQPPPYAEATDPSENLKTPVVVEELPTYTVHAALPRRSDNSRPWLRRLRCWLISFTLLLVVIAAIVGGLLGSKPHPKGPAPNNDPPSSFITALTATECDVGTFVFYQTNSTDIYVRGTLSGVFWNNTNSPEIPPMMLDFSEYNVQPIHRTNLTAVAYAGRNESSNLDLIVLRLFYIGWGELLPDLVIAEATLSFPFHSSSFPTAPLPIMQEIVANLTNPTSIAACYIEYWGLSLFYPTPIEPADMASSTGLSTLIHAFSNETTQWVMSNTTATTFSSASALTVACLNTNDVPPQIHILYMNQNNDLGHLVFTNDTWQPTSVISNVYNEDNIEGVENMAAVMPYTDGSELDLYYLINHRPYHAVIQVNEETGFNSLIVNLFSPSDLPDAVQEPPLIAAAAPANLDLPGIAPQQSVFYVWRINATDGSEVVQGSTIVNETMIGPIDLDSWRGDNWDVGGD